MLLPGKQRGHPAYRHVPKTSRFHHFTTGNLAKPGAKHPKAAEAFAAAAIVVCHLYLSMS